MIPSLSQYLSMVLIMEIDKPSWELELLDSDYEVMKGERTMLAKAFLDACYHHQMKLYQRISTSDSDGWYEANSVRVKTHADLFDWAKVWNHEYYVNRKQMQDQGFTELTSVPETSHHEFNREFHLVLGIGDTEDSKDSVWFCARLGSGKPSL